MVQEREQYFDDGVLSDLDFPLDAVALRVEHRFISTLALRGADNGIDVKVNVDL